MPQLTLEQITVHQVRTLARAKGFEHTAKALETIFDLAFSDGVPEGLHQADPETLNSYPRNGSFEGEVGALLCSACAASLRRSQTEKYQTVQEALRSCRDEVGPLEALTSCPVQGHVNHDCPIMKKHETAA